MGLDTVEAQTQTTGVDVDIVVQGPDAATVFDGLTVQIFEDDGGSPGAQVAPLDCGEMPLGGGTPTFVQGDAGCDLDPGSYFIDLAGVPANWGLFGNCTSSGAVISSSISEPFTVAAGAGNAECNLSLLATVVYIDKVVVGGGPADSDDFTIELLDGDTVVASGNDVADETCEDDFDTTKCGTIVIPAGVNLTIGEPTVENYVLTSVECATNLGQPPGDNLQPIGDEGFSTIDGNAYCVVTNTYVPPPTTTTTTTTEPPGTTAAPTTAAPTTQPPPPPAPPVEILPETGASSTSTGWIAAIATLFIAAGGVMVFVRRRPS
ncbi:MAG: LPXTG cell wall anchor domain-containing protein [Actinomycetota bacterium]